MISKITRSKKCARLYEQISAYVHCRSVHSFFSSLSNFSQDTHEFCDLANLQLCLRFCKDSSGRSVNRSAGFLSREIHAATYSSIFFSADINKKQFCCIYIDDISMILSYTILCYPILRLGLVLN